MTPRIWDIFCKVIDNFGDIGVCWRFAKQLHTETNDTIRLWVDDLRVMQKLVSKVNPMLTSQTIEDIEVKSWDTSTLRAETCFPSVLIEAFACDIPSFYLQATHSANPRFCWINLEYLTAEDWINDCHGMTSIHPQLGLKKYFYFPGFSEKTGGLFREVDLADRQRHFYQQQQALANRPIRISLFAYENPNITSLLAALASYHHPIELLVTDSKIAPSVREWLAAQPSALAGKVDQLQLQFLPFLSQDQYDELLWSCDFNLIRGEDSFLRAQWAGRPFLWHIYQQEEAAHLVKLNAFLEKYTADWPSENAILMTQLSKEWNTKGFSQAAIHQLLDRLSMIEIDTKRWQKTLEKQAPLAKQLALFVQNRLE